MSNSLQRDTALLFASLASRGVCGPGTVSLCVGVQAASVPLAVVGIGGACLSVGIPPAQARSASRQGAVDFIVDGLGEALRILKNEVRQRRPVSVAVTGDAAQTVDEMLRRGVQPQAVFAGRPDEAQGFLERGAVLLEWHAASPVFSLMEDVAESIAARRAGDQRLLASLRCTDHADSRIAGQWLQVAPRLFPKDRERWYLHSEEGKATA